MLRRTDGRADGRTVSRQPLFKILIPTTSELFVYQVTRCMCRLANVR
jgi:hypothetical protein